MSQFPTTVEALAGMIDHTLLKPFGKPEDIDFLCAEAVEHRFAAAVVSPAQVERCAKLLAGSGVRVCTVTGFPLGQNTRQVKAVEARDAVQRGAGEVDMVINVRDLQAGKDNAVRAEIADLVSICRPAGVISKVIIETCYLSDDLKRIACRLAADEGADFVKTSTGFGTAGATAADIALMRQVVGPVMGVKASGGIRTLESVLEMIEAGATRIGTSSGVEIMREFNRRYLA